MENTGYRRWIVQNATVVKYQSEVAEQPTAPPKYGGLMQFINRENSLLCGTGAGTCRTQRHEGIHY